MIIGRQFLNRNRMFQQMVESLRLQVTTCTSERKKAWVNSRYVSGKRSGGSLLYPFYPSLLGRVIGIRCLVETKGLRS